MRVHLNIPDLLLSQIDQLAELDHVDRTATVCRLLARGAAAELADWVMPGGADRGPSVASADQAHGVGATVQRSQRQADVELLPGPPPPPAQLEPPTFGPLGGSAPSVIADALDDLAAARSANEILMRKRAELGLDSAGLAPEQATTRAAVQGTGPRPMGDLPAMVRSARAKPGKAPPSSEEQH